MFDHCELAPPDWTTHARPVPVVESTYPEVGVDPDTEIDDTFRVFALAVVAKTLVAERLLVRVKVFKFEIVATFRVPTLAASTVAFPVEMLDIVARPSTYRFEPTGGLLRVPILTPFPKATFEFTDVH